MSRIAATLCGILVIALLAAGLTELTMAVGHRGSIADDNLVRLAGMGRTVASPSPSASPSPTPTPSAPPTPAPTPVPTPAQPTATTNSFVHMRAGKSTATPIVMDLNGDTQVVLLPDSDSQWQQVQYNGQTGYIFKTYLAY